LQRIGTALIAGAALCALHSAATAAPRMMIPPMMGKPDPQMKAVLDSLKELHPKPIEKLSPQQARLQPGPADAVKHLLKKQGRSTAPEPVGSVMDTFVPGPAGPVRVRVYKPRNATSNSLPVVVYFHGGGFVIGSIAAYDASCRAITNAAGAMVCAVAYRKAPEHRLPAAHEDSYAATQYIMKNAAKWGGDPRRVAVFGESAGGNLATDMCIMAKMRGGRMPIHQVLIYPMAQYGDFNTPSYIEQRNAKPLNRAMMKWFYEHNLPAAWKGRPGMYHPLVSPLRASLTMLRGLPPATIVSAELDPLRSEGALYADRLRQAGVPTKRVLYAGVTHEFFGMGAVVNKAKSAVNFVAGELKTAFNR